MRIASLSLTLVSAFALVALGCSSSPPPKEPGHEHGEHAHDHGGHHEHGGEHHGPQDGAMKGFHDVLAPVYHMDKGAPRDEKTCGSVAAMKDAAAKVAAEPKGDPADWKAKSDALSQSIAGLEPACAAAGRAEVSAKLEVVHDAFHALMKAARGEKKKLGATLPPGERERHTAARSRSTSAPMTSCRSLNAARLTTSTVLIDAISSITVRWFSRNVSPLSTRSTMRSDSPTSGDSSTEPPT